MNIPTIITTIGAVVTVVANTVTATPKPQKEVLASHAFSLEYRYPVASVSEVFKDNILLTVAYLSGKEKTTNPAWGEVNKPFTYELTLEKGQTFAFHDTVLPKYQGKVKKTTGLYFNAYEGFKSDGYLVGDGVCHLASLMYWVAKDAKLEALAPVNHDFANIPEVSREHGVAIYSGNAQQNLYITNTHEKPVTFVFDYNGKTLSVTVETPSA